jgi:hypothetical protein
MLAATIAERVFVGVYPGAAEEEVFVCMWWRAVPSLLLDRLLFLSKCGLK